MSTIPTNHSKNQHPIATVGALIFRGKKILLVKTHKWKNTWGIPGGKIKYGEEASKALKREIKEETGLQIRNIKFVLVQDCIHSQEFYKPSMHFLLLNYTATTTKTKIILNDEAEKYVWIEIKKASKLKLNKPTRYLIKKLTYDQLSEAISP